MEYTTDEVAAKLRMPTRTAKRYLHTFVKMGACGIRRGKRPDMVRWGYLVDASFLKEWQSGDLPAPWKSTLKAMGLTA